MSDHEQCDAQISRALATGHEGRAEFLAARCDIWHRRDEHPTPTTAGDAPDGVRKEAS